MISQALSYLIDQTESIYHTAKNPKKYFNNYENIKSNIIPSLNAQMKRYKDASYEAIKFEAIEEFMNELDLEKMKREIVENIKILKYLMDDPIKEKNKKYHVFDKSYSTPLFETEKIINPETLKGGSPEKNKSNLKDMKKYFRSKVAELQNFESYLTKRKKDIKKILKANLNSILNNYTNKIGRQFAYDKPITKLSDYLNKKFQELIII